MRSLSLKSHCVLGAMHPALLETAPDALKTNTTCKVYSRGYPLGSYMTPAAGAVDETLSVDCRDSLSGSA